MSDLDARFCEAVAVLDGDAPFRRSILRIQWRDRMSRALRHVWHGTVLVGALQLPMDSSVLRAGRHPVGLAADAQSNTTSWGS